MAKGLSLEDLGKMYGVKIEEKEPPKKNFSKQKNFGGGNKKFNGNSNKNFDNQIKSINSSKKTTAPYNFVSLPEKILVSPVQNVESFTEQIKSGKTYSGEISIAIESLTPLFIGGNFADKSKSFAPIDENLPIIPGSSLRGMFKNIFKIVTCGAFRGRTDSQKKGEDFNDEHIYFRCLMAPNNSPAWMNDLNKLYVERMISLQQGKPVKNARPGFLIQKMDGKFFIAPLKPNVERKSDFIMIKDFQTEYRPVKFKDSCVYWDLQKKRAYILTGNQWASRPEKLLSKDEYEKFKNSLKRKTETERRKIIREKKHGKQIIRFTKIDYVDWSREHWIELPDEVRELYENDRKRNSDGVNLFKDKGILKRDEIERLTNKKLPDLKSLIPCHFLEENGQITAFGHGQCFRIPYKARIGDAVEKNLKTDETDFSDAVFGREKFWASRVFFEDAKLISEVKVQQKAAAHPLMQPNPTSYQIYLEQGAQKLNHWDTNGAKLRGYKLYWHNGFADWKANAAELESNKGKSDAKRLTKDLTPLKSENKFQSKIRFQNLSEIELGALLMIFDLNGTKNPAYKIGMGKPLGFGSIKVTPKLFMESETAYTEIFEGDEFKNPYREESFEKYLNAFRNYVKNCGMEKIWLDVMKELNLMLDFDTTKIQGWSDKIKSMSGDVSQKDGVDERFKNRVPLPTIFEVLK